MSSRRLLFILGMHRSGTSALTRVIHLQGAVLPKTLMPAQADNPEGFFESLPVVKFNDVMLQDADRAWDDPRPIISDWWKHPEKQRQRIEQAKKILHTEFPEGELLVLKDPRLSRLFPIWLEASKQAGFTASVIICYRNPIEVAASLAKRNGIESQHAHLLWLTYTLEAEQVTRSLPRAFVNYHDLLDDWRNTLSYVYEVLNLSSLSLLGSVAETIDGCLTNEKCHYRVTTAQLLEKEALHSLLKRAWVTLLSNSLPSNRVFDGLNSCFNDIWKIITSENSLSKLRSAQFNMSKQTIQFKDTSGMSQRNIILHYHLFKNAGTSLDHTLQHNFKDGWKEQEGHGRGWCSEDVAKYLLQHPEITVLSSHTALLPPPVLPDTMVYPIIFIRHPIDRIRSIYEFERKQIADTEEARMAKKVDMAGYIEWRLNREGDRAIRDFQTYRLALTVPEMFDDKRLTEEDRAIKALDLLPFVGIVEKFSQSLERLEKWLKPIFPHLKLEFERMNVTQEISTSLESRLQEIALMIGPELYTRLLDANKSDIKLYEQANLKWSYKMNIDDVTTCEQLLNNLFTGVLHRMPTKLEIEKWLPLVNTSTNIDQVVQALVKSKEFENIQAKLSKVLFPPGHFYSPIVNVDEIRHLFDSPENEDSLPAVHINSSAMMQVWEQLVLHLRNIPFTEDPCPDYRYYFKNPAFSYGDGSILHAMLRQYKPKRLVEIGSGYSSACAVDTIDHYLNGSVEVSFIEPYPALLYKLIGEDAENRFEIHACTVQNANMEIFDKLEDRDFLFIDSTHVLKTGSDVCHELFNILPRLKSGVFIHFHDIFWPFEYGRKWVVDENRSWNELYGLRAFLMYNQSFEIVFFNDYFVRKFRGKVEQDYPAMLKNGGGSIWLRKK